MDKVTGGQLPADIWRRFMLVAHDGLAARDFPWLGDEPSGETVSAASDSGGASDAADTVSPDGSSPSQGKSRAARPSWATSMKRLQMSAGSCPPVTLSIGRPSSLPTQTPQTQSGVKPTNQASRQVWLVPVLPAAGRPIAARTPVPRAITPFSMPTITAARAGS